MSFDLYFLARRRDETWEDALAALEDNAAAERPLTAADLDLWRRLEPKLREHLPAAEVHEDEQSRELSDEASGIEVSLFPDELSLSVPYWYSGAEGQRLVQALRRIVTAIEGESGLTAYDPQADAPFLGDGAARAAASFDMVDQSFNQRGITPGAGRGRW